MRRDRCHSGGFLLRIMPPSWHTVPACTLRLCCRRAHSSLPQWSYAGGLFYFAATTLRRRNCSTLRQRKLESDADRYCDRDRCHSGGFYLGLCLLRGILSPPAPHDFAAGGSFYFAAKKIGIGRGIVAVTTFRRRNCSTLRLRKLESDAAS